MKATGAPKVAIQIELPDAERGHPDASIRRFDKLLRKLALTTLTERQRDIAAEELAAIERGPLLAEEKSSLDRHLQTLEHLELLRDQDIRPDRDDSGRLRIRSRDPLAAMVKVGTITAVEFIALSKYRDLFEERREILRSQLGSSNPGSGVIDIDREERQQARADKVRLLLLGAEAAVKARAARNGRSLMVLRLVAGEGRSLTSTARGGATRHRNKYAFLLAAQVLADHWGLT
jgi:hypothetical protein